MIDFGDISRSSHSLNVNILDSQRITKEQAQILLKQKLREFLKVECLLCEKFDNAEILTKTELEAQVNKAYSKIVLEANF